MVGRAQRLVAFATLLFAGCAPGLVLRDQTVYVEPGWLVAVPPAIRAFEIDSDRAVTKLPEEARAARARLEPAIYYSVLSRGGRFFSLETMKSLEGGEAFLRWCLRTLDEIEGEIAARAPGRTPLHYSVSDWSYPYDLEPLRASLNAQFVLVSLFLHGRHTTGGNVVTGRAEGFGGTGVDAKRRAGACVIDLGDGRVVWCAFTPLQMGALANDMAARRVVDRLLRGLYAMSPERATQARLIRPPAPPVRRPPAPPVPRSLAPLQPADDDD